MGEDLENIRVHVSGRQCLQPLSVHLITFLKSVWQMTDCEHKFLPGPLGVQPEMLSLLGCEPRECSCVIKSYTLVMVVDSEAR